MAIMRFSSGRLAVFFVPLGPLGREWGRGGAWAALISGSGLAGILAGGLILRPFGGMHAELCGVGVGSTPGRLGHLGFTPGAWTVRVLASTCTG